MKRKKKRALKERKKLNERLNLKMVLKGDDGPTMEGDELFSLKTIKDKSDMSKIIDQAPDVLAESEDEDDDDIKMKKKFERFNVDDSRLDSSGLYYKDTDSELEMESDDGDGEETFKEGLGLSDSESEEEKSPKKTAKNKKKEHPLITDLDYRDKETKRAQKAELWFERDVFKNLIDEKDEDADLDKMVEEYKKKGAKIVGEHDEEAAKKGKFKKETSSDSDYSSDETSDSDDSDSDYDVEQEMLKTTNNPKKDGFEIVQATKAAGIKGKRKLTEEELALGTLMVNSKRMKRDLIDGAWNRYAFNDSNLPDWFVEEEKKHMRREAPVPKVSSKC